MRFILPLSLLFVTSLVPIAIGAAKEPAPSLNSLPAQKMAAWCERLTPRLPQISLNDCRNTRLNPSTTYSHQGFPILVGDYHADRRRLQPTRVLLIGGIHGDEQTASSIVFKWMAMMQKTGVQEFQWKVVPSLNPDGLLAIKPTRVNARGVDLNRNFPTPNWKQEALPYWQKKTKSDPRRFPGNSPISEPESKWLHDTIKDFQPHVIISVHAPFGVLDLDGSVPPPQRFGRLLFNRVGVYPGSLGNYSGLHQNIPVLTIELPNAVKMPSEHEVVRIWQDMQGWIRKNLPVANLQSRR